MTMSELSQTSPSTCEPTDQKSDAYYNVGESMERYLERSMQPEVEQLFEEILNRQQRVDRVLDVGCASGRTSLFTLRRGVKELVGIELDGRAARIARRHMSRVIQADAAAVPLDYPEGYFDVILLTDVLEHLVDPWTALRRYVPYLRRGGRALIVLPNAGHISIISGLLAGTLRYEESGLMDRGHLRIFTQDMAVAMIAQSGLQIEQLLYRIDEEQWSRFEASDEIPLGAGVGTLKLNPRVVSQQLKLTYFARKLHFLAQRPTADAS
jgi:SAM-dependent methyltransferase